MKPITREIALLMLERVLRPPSDTVTYELTLDDIRKIIEIATERASAEADEKAWDKGYDAGFADGHREGYAFAREDFFAKL